MGFRALLTERDGEGRVSSRVAVLDEGRLPAGNVTVAVEWAGFNYKDGLVLTGQGNLVRTYPHVGGVDLAGRVVDSDDERYQPGQPVVLTGWRVGETHWGGFAELARVDADWLVPLPGKFSTRDAMVLGTAGLTAMLAINRLSGDGLERDGGEVVVTGAAGGVGSFAVMLLARLGHKVTAVTGRPEQAGRLFALGAETVIDRADLLAPTGKVLDKERWSAAVDPVGGPMLGALLRKMRHGGRVAAIGMAGGAGWEASVIPFILRGVSLFGIDSVMQPYEARVGAWDRLAGLYVPGVYEALVTPIGLADLPEAAARILRGAVAGRVIVDPKA